MKILTLIPTIYFELQKQICETCLPVFIVSSLLLSTPTNPLKPLKFITKSLVLALPSSNTEKYINLIAKLLTECKHAFSFSPLLIFIEQLFYFCPKLGFTKNSCQKVSCEKFLMNRKKVYWIINKLCRILWVHNKHDHVSTRYVGNLYCSRYIHNC